MLRVFMGKIMNPASTQVDINFNLKIYYVDPSTQEESAFSENSYNMFSTCWLNHYQIITRQTHQAKCSKLVLKLLMLINS